MRRSHALGLLAATIPARLSAQSPKVRVVYTLSDSGMQAYYGVEQGFFAKAGLDVELLPFTASVLMIEAVAAGALDVSFTDPMQLANAVQRGVPLAAFAGGATYTAKAPTTLLCVAKNSTLKNPRDLEGQAFSTPSVNGGLTLATRAWLERNGVDNAKVKVFELPFQQMAAALDRGTVAAAALSEPYITYASDTIRPFGRVMEAFGKNPTITFWYTTRPWAERNPDLMRRLTAAMYETARWANAHPSATLATLVKTAKLDIERIRTMNRATLATAFSPRDMQSILDVALKYKFIESPVAANALAL